MGGGGGGGGGRGGEVFIKIEEIDNYQKLFTK